ncbi:hypothetical protein PYW08_012577 [Mythimna loreyi]|uniref:Uncharacterized protein n=1 Tax=Mythimna loreyi TaxID=667449 RepID=A0ACC2Q2E7_9NEOP|nr:hypothetical protein PYW08_012577 [Mythimna loreyi]
MSRNNTLSQSSRTSMTGSYGRQLRLRNMLEEISTVEDDASNNLECMDQTSRVVKEAKNLRKEGNDDERVRHPGESYLDSRVLRAASDVTVRCAEAVSGNINIYDKHELARHIATNPDFWHFPFPLEIPVAAHVFGSFAPVAQRPTRVRRQVERQQAAQLKEPEKVDKLEKSEEGSQMVNRVNRFIVKTYKQRQQPLSYFHTVLDPDSFSKSVENIYHVSFLVRDGLISVTLDDEYGLPFITPLSATPEQVDLSDEKQFIVSIDMQRWQDLISAFDIRKPMMVLKNK